MQANIQRMEKILANIDTAAAKAPNTMDLVQENLNTFRNAGQTVGANLVFARFGAGL